MNTDSMNASSAHAAPGWDPNRISPLLRLALLLGILVHLAGFFIFRVVSSPLPVSEDRNAFVAYVSTDEAEDEVNGIGQASLFDSAPLFIPTEWTSVSNVYNVRDEEEWQVFPEFEPGIDLASEVRPTRLSLSFIDSVNQPVDLLDLRFWNLFSHLGQIESKPVTSPAWQSFASVKVLGSKEPHKANAEIPLDMNLSDLSTMPLPVVIYLSMAAPSLPAGAPLLESSSGSDEVDKQVLEWLARPSTLAKLPAGFLELRIFP